MNWTLILTLYGKPVQGAHNPLLQFMAARSSHVLIGGTGDALDYQMFHGEVPELMNLQEVRPFSYYVFSDSEADELSVINRSKTYFNFFHGRLAEDEPQRTVLNKLLNMGREPQSKDTNYTTLIHKRVMSSLHGKFSAMVAELSGASKTFLFRSQKLPLKMWLVSFEGVYYLVASNVEGLVDELEDHVLKTGDSRAESFYQQSMEFPINGTLALHPVYVITKFRTRMHNYDDKSARKLLIVNYFRRYLKRQWIAN